MRRPPEWANPQRGAPPRVHLASLTGMLQSLSTSLPALVGRQRCVASWKTGSDKRYRSADSRGGGDGSTLAIDAILEARKVVRKFRAEPLLGPFSDIATSALNAHVRLFRPAFVHSCRMAKLHLIGELVNCTNAILQKITPAVLQPCILHIPSGAFVHMLTVPDVHTCTNSGCALVVSCRPGLVQLCTTAILPICITDETGGNYWSGPHRAGETAADKARWRVIAPV